MAIKDRRIEFNPVEKVSRFKVDNKMGCILTIEEMRKLIEVSPEHLKPIVIMALNT